jgi:hypothetical protein
MEFRSIYNHSNSIVQKLEYLEPKEVKELSAFSF